ncbi:P63C domain-containing protein [Blastococcus xanthinilyticus]|uniref:P63C domain-containing protein n=1 Tax=Blastococcus xanthinilyticus TaxID=1564164 RepID=A0A5S5CLF7_9ACTN|nr:P63C domain-containing protein [Blastococcus xanthinilyticus]TYP82018.1 P63C domain-containing protein [Blastococcus xanthinilyticus]
MSDSTDVEDATNAALFHLGASEGGKARARRLTPEQRSEIARRAAEARWVGKARRAPHSGALKIGDKRIECAVLEDGTRVLSQGTMLEALGRAKSMGRRGGPDDDKRAPFLSANNLEPFIGAELLEKLAPIEYKMAGQRFMSVGYRAEALPEVCDVYLAARRAGALLPSQAGAADAAEILIRSLAKVGIIALVDEATGYQEARARDELRRLLEQYVAEAFRPWVKTFPNMFFEEIYRLHGWTWVEGKAKHPQYVGVFINTYVYDHLPEGVADELRRVNPTLPSGRRARKHHQHLTVDTGSVHLDRQITSVTTLMQVSDTIEEFKELFGRKYGPKPQPKVLRVEVGPDDEVMTLFEVDEPS